MDDPSALPAGPGVRARLDESILIQAAQRDPTEFVALHRVYGDRVYQYMLACTGNSDDAADLTQQVFLQALGAIPGYRDRGLPFSAWLFRIARNVAVSAHRRVRADLSLDAMEERLQPRSLEDVEERAIHNEELARLRALIAGLCPEERELITLRFMSGLTIEEIASVVGGSRSTVHRRLSHILQTLKERYSEG